MILGKTVSPACRRKIPEHEQSSRTMGKSSDSSADTANWQFPQID